MSCGRLARNRDVRPVELTRLPNGHWAIDFGASGTFLTVTPAQLTALLVAIRDSRQFESFPIRRI